MHRMGPVPLHSLQHPPLGVFETMMACLLYFNFLTTQRYGKFKRSRRRDVFISFVDACGPSFCFCLAADLPHSAFIFLYWHSFGQDGCWTMSIN
mmetsp:Transcript_276/g.388  ORF Transcript_276/g.388 Transcript_276/m.388 type:complete len:94 (+) Transcript_276:1423-1704(+)